MAVEFQHINKNTKRDGIMRYNREENSIHKELIIVGLVPLLGLCDPCFNRDGSLKI